MTILKGLKKKHDISVKFISQNAMKRLVEYDWPGNVREMENTLERVVLIHDNPLVRLENIDNILKSNPDTNIELSEKNKTQTTNKDDLYVKLDNHEEKQVENLTRVNASSATKAPPLLPKRSSLEYSKLILEPRPLACMMT